ncbi:hypothetical protein K438DRAFT_1996600 [Mycena galopus ATCC 62051]|nr:hypothetical protein K438DRAFT_1996600 [Mycena galopus ATCC 62051]
MTFRLLSVVALLSAAVALGATNGIHSILKPNRLRVSDVDSPCIIQASVRAEDLSPGHISQGELRVKVSRPDCAHEVVSVVLRLQLTEFGEFVSLKEGVVLPDQWQIVLNHTTAAATTVHDIVYDYQPYAEAISDPELWNVQAQERRAWTTETTLLDRKPDLTHPTVTPFTVAVPNVNYPPGADRGRIVRVARHAFGDLGYQYTAIATFADGRIIAVPAGYTTFVPTDLASPTMTPSSWNITFVNHCEGWTQDLDRCLPKDQRSEFVAEVKLEHGNIVQKGTVAHT